MLGTETQLDGGIIKAEDVDLLQSSRAHATLRWLPLQRQTRDNHVVRGVLVDLILCRLLLNICARVGCLVSQVAVIPYLFRFTLGLKLCSKTQDILPCEPASD